MRVVLPVAVISRALGDRDLNNELLKMEAALQVATELGFLPIDVCILKRTIGEWKGDSHMVSEAAKKLREHGWIRDSVKTEQLVEGLVSGNVKQVDLKASYGQDVIQSEIVNNTSEATAGEYGKVIEKKTSEATVDEYDKVAELRKQLAAARRTATAANDAGDEAGEDFARSMVKKIKKELEVLTGILVRVES